MSDMNAPRDQPAHRAALAVIFGARRTERLMLRRVRADDGTALLAIDGDPETHRYNSSSPAPDLAACEERLRAWLRRWDEDGVGYWAITLAPSADDVIGFGGVQRIIWRERVTLNLYYRFAPRAWGQGYAAEMARAAVALARAHLPAWPVIARIQPANTPSLRVAERAGLRRFPALDDDGQLIFALGWDV